MSKLYNDNVCLYGINLSPERLIDFESYIEIAIYIYSHKLFKNDIGLEHSFQLQRINNE